MIRTVTITLAFAALLALNGCVVYGGPYYHPYGWHPHPYGW